MSRKLFLTIAAAVGILFSVYMMAAPDKIMEGMGCPPNAPTNVVLQAMSIIMLSSSIVLFLARADGGSIALQAIIVGNLVMHVCLLPIDWLAYQKGTFTQLSGIIPGSVIHIVFAIGFLLCLKNLPKR